MSKNSFFLATIVFVIVVLLWNGFDTYINQTCQSSHEGCDVEKKTSTCKKTQNIRLKQRAPYSSPQLEWLLQWWMWQNWSSSFKKAASEFCDDVVKERTYAASPNFLVWQGLSWFLRRRNQVSICLCVFPHSDIRATISLWNHSTGDVWERRDVSQMLARTTAGVNGEVTEGTEGTNRQTRLFYYTDLCNFTKWLCPSRVWE